MTHLQLLSAILDWAVDITFGLLFVGVVGGFAIHCATDLRGQWRKFRS